MLGFAARLEFRSGAVVVRIVVVTAVEDTGSQLVKRVTTMKNIRAWAVSGVAGLICLIFAILAFGGAGQAQPAVAEQARDESPLAQTYIVLGRHASRLLPVVGSMSRDLARVCFADTYAAIEADPDIGLHLLQTESRGFMAALAKWAYWGAPILLLASLVLYFLRPRTIHLMRR